MSDGTQFDAEAQRIAQERLGTINTPEAAPMQHVHPDPTLDPNSMGAGSGMGADLTVNPAPQPQAAYIPPTPPVSPAPPAAPAPQPMQPEDSQHRVIQFMQPNPAPTLTPDQAVIKPRSQVREETDRKRNKGVVFHLEHTGSDAVIRDIPFADSTMLLGVPAALRDVIDDAIRDKVLQQQVAENGKNVNTLTDALALLEKADKLTQAVCIAAFIKPRLVLTEAELVPGDELVWLVTDVDERDRQAVLNFIQRNRMERALSGGAADAVAGFPGAGVGSATDSPASNPVQ